MITVHKIVATTPIQHVLRLCEPPEWTENGACLGERELFDLTHDSRSAVLAGKATSFCVVCPVVAICLAQALRREHGLCASNRYGVVGGKTPTERAAMAPV